MKTVLIIGAGATLAEALPSQPKKSEEPPLDATFFDWCRVSVSKSRGTPKLSKYMSSEFGIELYKSQNGMEEVFNYVYSDAFSGNPTVECLEAYWSLIRLYRAALASTTNPLNGKSRSGFGQVLRTLYEHKFQRNTSILTFNQDLVVEKSIEYTKSHTKYQDIPWNIEETYCTDFEDILPVAGSSTRFTGSDETSIKVLKLHGSLNWVYRVRSNSDPKNSVREPSGPLSIIDDQMIRQQLTQSVKGSRRSWHLIPLIVPPIYEKSRRYGSVLKPVWQTARLALREAEELIIFGYSFPDADFASKALIRQALHHNEQIRTVHVIDINPEIAAKVAKIIDCDSCHYYRDARTFRDVYCDENR